MSLAMLSVHDLVVVFDTPAGVVRAVDGVSFQLEAEETLALVGESGSGKSLSALSVLRLVPHPGRVESGRVFFQEKNLLRAPESELRKLRGRELAMVFQDPLSALHPMLTVERQLSEVLETHAGLTRRGARGRVVAALGEVGLAEPERFLGAHANQLSGGQRQRVLIAMAILMRPRVLFADEPTTALDVTLQAQILDLLEELQRKHGTGIVLITHDLGIVAGRADRVQVLYAGRTVESAGTHALFAQPLHPYSAALLGSVGRLDRPAGALPSAIPGQPPDPLERPEGCAFHPRCAFVTDACRRSRPELEEPRGHVGRRTACFESARLLPRP